MGAKRDSILRRRGQDLWRWPDRLYVPMPLPLKNWFGAVARQHGMSQAELGLVVVEAAKRDSAWLDRVITLYRESCHEEGCSGE